MVCVVDATNLRRNLRLVLAVQRLGLPCVVALNMADLARKRGLKIDPDALARELGVPGGAHRGREGRRRRRLRALLDDRSRWHAPAPPSRGAAATRPTTTACAAMLQRLGLDAAGAAHRQRPHRSGACCTRWSDRCC